MRFFACSSIRDKKNTCTGWTTTCLGKAIMFLTWNKCNRYMREYWDEFLDTYNIRVNITFSKSPFCLLYQVYVNKIWYRLPGSSAGFVYLLQINLCVFPDNYVAFLVSCISNEMQEMQVLQVFPSWMLAEKNIKFLSQVYLRIVSEEWLSSLALSAIMCFCVLEPNV